MSKAITRVLTHYLGGNMIENCAILIVESNKMNKESTASDLSLGF